MINIVFVMLLNQQERPPRKYCYQSSENIMLIEIHLSQIRISDSKREKVLYVRYARTFYLQSRPNNASSIFNLCYCNPLKSSAFTVKLHFILLSQNIC